MTQIERKAILQGFIEGAYMIEIDNGRTAKLIEVGDLSPYILAVSDYQEIKNSWPIREIKPGVWVYNA